MRRNRVIWGVLLWLIGYLLGFLFFAFIPPTSIGWVIMPIGTLFTLWVLLKKITPLTDFKQALYVSLQWTAIALIGDYLGIVLLLHPADGYYKLDVYLYYTLTFVLPLLVCARNKKKLA